MPTARPWRYTLHRAWSLLVARERDADRRIVRTVLPVGATGILLTASPLAWFSVGSQRWEERSS